MAEVRLIDANALNLYLADVQFANRGWKDDFCDTLDEIMEIVDERPTIDPESLRPVGCWLNYSDDKFTGYGADGRIKYRKCRTYECCFCGRNTAVKSNYCPNCGAKMEGKK